MRSSEQVVMRTGWCQQVLAAALDRDYGTRAESV
jgi:hypothetical protein